MTEYPIIFSGPMVKAILEGRKTQTRRICRQGNDNVGHYEAWAICPAKESGWIAWFGQDSENIENFTKQAYPNGFSCPYGKPGDRLWIRENFQYILLQSECTGPEDIRYQATADELELACTKRWRPSIHMSRWASRITVEVTEVRVQRLQAISKEDAISEGCEFGNTHGLNVNEERERWHGPERQNFANLWDSINGKRAPWENNPWVWAISFRRIR
jgi:hypothetical protein